MTTTFDLIVRGGEVVNHAGRGLADVGITDGRVVKVGDLGQASAGEVIDATGLTVLPGVIDTQVHFREPGLEWKEDLETGSRAAALGGVTAVFEMPNTEPATTNPEALADKLARARDRMWTDHAFYVGGTHENARLLGELERLPGCCGVKVFMGASTGTLLVADDDGVREVLRHVKRRATFHSEDEYRLVERRPLARAGDWTSHPEVRDAQSAIQSTHRLVRLARETGARIHVLHVTTAEEIDFLADNKDVATVEVTPQHLTLVAPEAYARLKGLAQMEVPQEAGEVLAPLAHVAPDPRAPDRRVDLGTRAYDTRIGQQPRPVRLAVAGDLLRIEVIEGGAERLALLENGDPRQPGLEPVQHQLLPQGAGVVLGHAPFGVVIGDIQRVGPAPSAA